MLLTQERTPDPAFWDFQSSVSPRQLRHAARTAMSLAAAAGPATKSAAPPPPALDDADEVSAALLQFSCSHSQGVYSEPAPGLQST